MRISPTEIHHLLAFAALYVGESATMASESAILGTPAIFVSPVGRGYTDELERRYGLVRTLSNDSEDSAIETAASWLGSRDIGSEWAEKRDRMLRDKIDVTSWMVEFVEAYA